MSGSPQLSVVVPVHNEEDNVAPLVDEIVAALRGRLPFEIPRSMDAVRASASDVANDTVDPVFGYGFGLRY